jgi:hypothetical protein
MWYYSYPHDRQIKRSYAKQQTDLVARETVFRVWYHPAIKQHICLLDFLKTNQHNMTLTENNNSSYHGPKGEAFRKRRRRSPASPIIIPEIVQMCLYFYNKLQ